MRLLASLAISAALSISTTAVFAQDLVEFTYADNSVEVPRAPKRVVTIQGRTDLEFALIAGWNVIASGNFVASQERPGEQFGDLVSPEMQILEVNDMVNVHYEQLLGLEPDLIIMGSYGYQVDWYGNERLSQIAPILPVSDAQNGWKIDLVEQLKQFGLDERAEGLLASYDAGIAEISAEIAPLVDGKRVAIMSSGSDNVNVQFSNLQMQTAHDLGLDLPYWAPDSDPPNRQFAAESFSELADIDLIILQNVGGFEGGPTWERLPAVEAGHVYVVDQRDNQGFGLAALNFAEHLPQAAQLLRE